MKHPFVTRITQGETILKTETMPADRYEGLSTNQRFKRMSSLTKTLLNRVVDLIPEDEFDRLSAMYHSLVNGREHSSKAYPIPLEFKERFSCLRDEFQNLSQLLGQSREIDL